MTEQKRTLRQQLEGAEQQLSTCSAFVGFDGFIDTLARPVLQATEVRGENQHFETIEEFGKFLAFHKNVSCSVEMDVLSHMFGGNTPHLGNALATLGVNVSCVGTFGSKAIDPLFLNLNCGLYSFGDAGVSTALEFKDGKVLLGYHNLLKELDWSEIIACTKEKGIESLVANSDLVALVNWSELSYSHELWEAVLTNCLLPQKADRSRTVFFDLCDITRKFAEEVVEVLRLMGMFAQRRKTVLSMNENESIRLGKVINNEGELESIAKVVHDTYGIDEIVIHTRDRSILYGEFGVYTQNNGNVSHPAVLTGAGDNFNGASCAAMLLNLSPQNRLIFAATLAHEYVRNGKTPSMDAIRIACQHLVSD